MPTHGEASRMLPFRRGHALAACLGVLALTGVLAFTTSKLSNPWDLAGVLPWALVLSGPVTLLLLAPHVAGDAHPWVRCSLGLFPVAAGAFLFHEVWNHLLFNGLAWPSERTFAILAMHLVLVGALVGAVLAHPGLFVPPRDALRQAWPLVVIALVPFVGKVLGLVVIAVQAAWVLRIVAVPERAGPPGDDALPA